MSKPVYIKSVTPSGAVPLYKIYDDERLILCHYLPLKFEEPGMLVMGQIGFEVTSGGHVSVELYK